MNRQTKVSDSAGKWDESAIDKAYEDLLDSTGWILDQVMLTGCLPVFNCQPPLFRFLSLIQAIETELLVQWKIKQKKGLNALFLRHREWLNGELRNSNGYLFTWNQFHHEAWMVVGKPASTLLSDPWKSLLLLTISDWELMRQCAGLNNPGTREESLQPVCSFFERLYNTCPHHLALSFLNLIEIGTRSRPQLVRLGECEVSRPEAAIPSVIDKAFHDVAKGGDWQNMTASLVEFWKSNSGGEFSSFPAFIVENQTDDQYSLHGIEPAVWLDFEDLIGIEKNRDKLIHNTRNFMEGQFAHHVLLWGARGTGKSSSVLALMKVFVNQGLRLIEIRKEDLHLIPVLSFRLRNKPEKFILFCDDLSFEKNSSDYKHLKTIMEGSVFNPAKNMMLIATANRKDLVFRGELDERLPEHKQLIDEKRAIDDRFGLKLFFEAPVFKDLEKILFACADKTGLQYGNENLLHQFRKFAQLNNHDQPSGRTVRQFINEWQQEMSDEIEN
jgi:predicted AAA+ superfamily ATPase